MPNMINPQSDDITYIEVCYNHERRADRSFAWINDRLFLPAILLDEDPGEAIRKVLASPAEVYQRGDGELDYFVPAEWLEDQCSDMDSYLSIREMQKLPQKFRPDPAVIIAATAIEKTEKAYDCAN